MTAIRFTEPREATGEHDLTGHLVDRESEFAGYLPLYLAVGRPVAGEIPCLHAGNRAFISAIFPH